MSDDLKDLLGRATSWYNPPPIGPDGIARRQDRRQRASRVATIAVAFAVFVIASILVWRGAVTDGPTPATPNGSDVLEVPARGDASAEFLSDGRPVFVIHYVDGTVSVIDAFSPYRPFGIRELVAWCSPGHFVGWPDQSFFDKYGVWRGGTSAPPGLAVFAFDVLRRDAAHDPTAVRVGGIGPTVAGHQNLSSRRTYPSTCRSTSGSRVELVEHPLDPSMVSDSPADLAEAPTDGWMAVDGFLSISSDGSVVLCSSSILSECRDGAPVEAIEAIDAPILRDELAANPDSPFAGNQLWLDRAAHGAIVDIAIVHIS
jgi:hypothetical protein